MQKSWKYEWLCSIYIHKFVKVSVVPQAESQLNKKGNTMSFLWSDKDIHVIYIYRQVSNIRRTSVGN